MAFIPLLGVLSNTTGSQTLSGNITLNSPLRLQGGGGGGTGATNFPGNIQGSSYLRIINGRAVFSGNLSNAGGFFIGEQGNTTRVTFNGTTTGVAPLVLNGAGTNQVSYTSGALPTGTISTNNVDSFSVPLLIPLDSSTINNPFSLTGITFLQRSLRRRKCRCRYWRWNQCDLGRTDERRWRIGEKWRRHTDSQQRLESLHRHHDG